MKLGYDIDRRIGNLPPNPFRRRRAEDLAQAEAQAAAEAAQAPRPQNWQTIFDGAGNEAPAMGFGFARAA